MGDHSGNASVTVIGVCDLGQVASLHVASVHPAVQLGTRRKLGGKGGNLVGGVQYRWLQVGFPSPMFACWGLMSTPDSAPVGCSSQSSGPAWVEAWLPDAQAHSAKVALAYLAHICWGAVASNGRYFDLCLDL